MKALEFQIVANAQVENSINSFCNFSTTSVCWACTGDLSI